MECVSSTSMQVLWNGEITKKFKPSRGVRQGDPISPYLSVLCIERLSHLILQGVDKGDWKPIHISRGGPLLSHMFFADDMILCAEASLKQIQVIMDVIGLFCRASGQKISS